MTANLFATLGVKPLLGRAFTNDDGDGVVVISHALWQSHFGSDPHVIGRALEVDGDRKTVIGVLTQSFVSRNRSTSHKKVSSSVQPSDCLSVLLRQEGHSACWMTIREGYACAQCKL